jgi:hypothetical protein
MAEWLRNVVEEVNRQFNDLPEWKKTDAEDLQARYSEERKPQAAVREPRQD